MNAMLLPGLRFVTPSRYPGVFVVFVAAIALAEQAAAARFTPLGYLPDGYFYSDAVDVSADGRAVVGQAHHGGFGNEAFRWTAESGMQGLGDFSTGDYWSSAYAVSNDGSVVVGDGTIGLYAGIDAFRWTSGSGMQSIGYLSNDSIPYSYAVGVSGDGSSIVGHGRSASGNEAFRWTEGEGMVGLGDLSGGSFASFASAISSDGKVIVGNSRSANDALELFRWTEDTGMVGLGFPPVGSQPHPSAISADGEIIVGSAALHGWRWSADTGFVELPKLPGTAGVLPADMSADGSMIVGSTSATTDSTARIPAFIWTPRRGTRALQSFLEEDYGLSLDGWTLTTANGISDDGMVIVGRGVNPSGRPEAWVVDLKIPEPGAAALLTIAAITVLSACPRQRRFCLQR